MQICLSLAQGILADRRKPGPTPRIWQKQWHVTSDTVLAGAVVASELVYGNHHDQIIRQQLRAQVEDCIDMLQTLGPVTRISERGVRLLNSMLRRDAQAQAALATTERTSRQSQHPAPPSQYHAGSDVGLGYSEDAVVPEALRLSTEGVSGGQIVTTENAGVLDFGWVQNSGVAADSTVQYAAVPSAEAEGHSGGVLVDDFAAVGEWLDEILGNSGFDHFLS